MNIYEHVQRAPNFYIPNWSNPVRSLPQDAPIAPTALPLPQEVQPESLASSQSSVEHTSAFLSQQPCPHCQGQKYNFTAYFHCTKYFAIPPHELLPLIERSYLLKNSLQSMILTYAMREIEPENLGYIESGLRSWSAQVEGLVQDVLGRDDRIGVLVERMRAWAIAMAGRIWEHVCGVRRVEGVDEKKQMKTLVSDFRRGWEGVWVALSTDYNISP